MRSKLDVGLWLRAGVVVALLLGGVGCGDDDCDDATPIPTPVPTPTPTECPLPLPFCGGDFPLNLAQTTTFGPAWADVITDPVDFLPCFGPYALCYYANCPTNPDGTVSACECFEWFGPNFVLVNGILNADSWQATDAQCTADPASCQQRNGSPVCKDINRGDFYSNATRVSTFGFYRAAVEPIGEKDCTQMPGPYAGCMTAPCAGPVMSNPDGTVTIECECPVYDGPYQVGQSDVQCDTSPTVWSASYNTIPPPNPCDIVAGGCIPDAPQDECGCPLYSSSTMLPPGSDVDCDLVCQQYNTCLKSDTEIQLGYTCDSTLCTSSTHALVFDACLGLQNCDLSEIFKAEQAAGCSCCASQLCNCEANSATENKIFALDAAQRAAGETPQCDINGTLCGTAP
jgi:hypothetical protein